MTTLGLRAAAADELAAWAAGTAASLGRLRHLAGRVDAEGAQADGEAVVAANLEGGALREGHSVVAMLDPASQRAVGWLWLHTVDDSRGRVAQVQHLWFEGDALPRGVSADDVMDAVERAVAGADLLKVATYTADPVLGTVVAGRGLEPDVLGLRRWLDDHREPPPAPQVRLAPMSDESWARWWSVQEQTYADELVQAGLVAREHSRERSRTDLAALLPDGRATPGHDLWSVTSADDAEVGVLWVAHEDRRAFVFDVLVHPEHRRRGYALAMMGRLHDCLRERGTTSVALSVFGWNTGARALYERLGYVPVEALLSRSLRADP